MLTVECEVMVKLIMVLIGTRAKEQTTDRGPGLKIICSDNNGVFFSQMGHIE